MSNATKIQKGLVLCGLLAAQPLLGGCQTLQENPGLAAALGAVGGAAVGYAVAPKGNRVGGAIIGAVVGGAAGYLLAKHFGAKATEEQRATPEFKQSQAQFEQGNAALEQAQKTNDAAQKSAAAKDAAAHYDESAKLTPYVAEPVVNRGLAELEQGDKAAAKASFEQALQVDPQNAEARSNLEKLSGS